MYERYCALRDSKNVKDADVSRNTGIPKSTFSDWKKGKSSPKQDKLKKIANYLDVSLEYLMTGKEPEMDYLYNDENAEFLIEITRMSKNKDFVARMKKYMELMNESKKSVDDMIDFLHAKEHQGED